MATTDLESHISAAEQAADAVAHALLQGFPDLLESASRDLHRAASALANALPLLQRAAARDPSLRQRLGQVLNAIGMQREACLRRSAMVERSLNSILPASRSSTYGSAAAPYAAGARHSGAFKLLSA